MQNKDKYFPIHRVTGKNVRATRIIAPNAEQLGSGF